MFRLICVAFPAVICSGTVRFRVDVDETGAVDGCIGQEAFSDPAFREATCKLIEKRAHFMPAVGAD